MKIYYRNTKTGLLFFSGLTIIILVVLLLVFYSEGKSLEESIQSTVKTDLKAYSVDIDNKIAFIASDVLLLEDIILNRELLKYEAGETVFRDVESRETLELDVIDWVKNRNVYDQVRIIDMDGVEIFRVNYNNGTPIVIDGADNLQDKSGRYYFENAIILDDDVLYMSKIDLNVENNQIEYIEGLPKEMLRIGSTLFDSNGNQLGMILVNYFADHLFHDDETRYSQFTTFEVINQEGYYLHSDDLDIEYGFMFPDKLDFKFNKYHDYELLLNASSNIEQEIYEGEIYTSLIVNNIKMSDAITTTIGRNIDVYSDNGDIYIFGEVDFFHTSQYVQLKNTYIVLAVIFLLLSLLISRLIDEIIFGRTKHLQTLEFTSTHDLLTGLPNRAKVFKMIEYYNSRNTKYSLLFLDFDKFKNVNDEFGHQIGDKVLIEGSRRLQSCIRETDIVARLGGDEFLIVLSDTINKDVIKRISKNIKDRICEEFTFDKIVCTIGVSIGVSIQDGTKTTEDMVNESDERMYQDKNEFRNKY